MRTRHHREPEALDHALKLHEAGCSLLPLAPRRKQPHLAALRAVHGSERWSLLRERRASQAQVRAWFETDAAAGIGLIVTPGLVVADVDRPQALRMTHPATPCVRTARGWHLYFAATISGVHQADWGELRGTGSYLVVPPSIHETGRRYRWVLSFDDVRLARLPRWLAAAERPRSTVDCTSTGDEPSARLTHSPSVAAAMALMGRPTAIDPAGRTREIRCLLPTHQDRHPSAGLYRSARGAWRYKCHGCGANLSIPRLFAVFMGGDNDLSSAAARLWLVRLWDDADVSGAPMGIPDEVPG